MVVRGKQKHTWIGRENQLWVYFGQSKETSDFIVDCLERWWKENSQYYRDMEELMMEEIRSGRELKIERIEGMKD